MGFLRRRLGALAALVALAVVLSACVNRQPPATAAGEVAGEGEVEPLEGTVEEAVDLSGQVFWVGGAESTPEDATTAILAHMAMQLLRSAGATVEDQSELGNPFTVRDSLLSGEIDLSWEGVAVAWTVFLREPEGDLGGEAMYLELEERDLQENGVAWLPPAAFDHAGGVAMAADVAADLKITTLTDMAAYLEETGDEATLCVTSGFVDFPADGRVEFEEKLGIDLGDASLRIYDPIPIYPDTGNGTCTFGLVDSTSGRIPQYDLEVLTDDVGLFLPDLPAVAVREDVLAETPELVAIFAAVGPRLTATEIRDLNRAVIVDGEPVGEVVADWLVDAGLVAAPAD